MARKTKGYVKWSSEQLAEAGIDSARLARLVRTLAKCSDEMREMGLHMYGASGSGNLIHRSRPTHRDAPGPRDLVADQGAVVANVGQGWDGGDW